MADPNPAHMHRNTSKQARSSSSSGEGEATLQELLSALRAHADKLEPDWRARVAGVAYFDEFGRFQQNASRSQIADLDAQPWPARQTIDIQRYVDTWRTHHAQGSVNFITARGCPYKCRWCSHQVYGQTHRRAQPDQGRG